MTKWSMFFFVRANRSANRELAFCREISNRFGVEGIPALIVLNGSDAKLLTKEGRAGVEVCFFLLF